MSEDSKCSCNLCDMIEKTTWVSVKDKLPEEGIDVLVWDGNLSLDNIPKYEIAAYRTFANGSHFISGPYSLQGITHWMPLPNPTEEK